MNDPTPNVNKLITKDGDYNNVVPHVRSNVRIVKSNAEEARGTSRIVSVVADVCVALPFNKWALVPNRKKMEIQEPKQYLGTFLVEGGRSMISGGSGIGKTLIGLSMADAIARGDGFAIFPGSGEQIPVLYLDYELGRVLMHQRLAPYDGHFAVMCFDDPELGEHGLLPIDTPEGQEQVRYLLNEYESRVLMIDNLAHAVVGSILGGSDKNNAHDKLSPFTRGLSKNGVASVLFHHAGHDQTRFYGDSRNTWQLMSHAHVEVSENQRDGEKRVKFSLPKMRLKREPGANEPFEMVFDDQTGHWHVVGKTQPKARPLSDRQQWIFAAGKRLLDAKGMRVPEYDFPVAFTSDLRKEYKNQHFAHSPNSSSERMGWQRDVEALVTYLTCTDVYFYQTRRP